MFITVNVTKKNIKEGQPLTAKSCPIALALNKLVRKYTFISVTGDEFNIKNLAPTKQFSRLEIKLPPVARKFVESFDQSKEVSPFSFKISISKKDAEKYLKPSVIKVAK